MPDEKASFQEWFEKGNHDLITAKLAFEAGAPTDTVAVLLQQAAEKHLKGYLLSKGWQLKKTHDLRELIDRAIERDAGFNKYVGMARLLTAMYVEDRYPSGLPENYPKKEIAGLMEQAQKLVDKIRDLVDKG